MSKRSKHTKSHKKSKIKDRKRKSLAARRLNELRPRGKGGIEVKTK